MKEVCIPKMIENKEWLDEHLEPYKAFDKTITEL